MDSRWKLNLAILCGGQFLVMGSMTMVLPFLALYIQELGITDPRAVSVWTGVIFGVNFFSSFLFQPIWGRLADRIGRKIMLLRSAFGMAVLLALMALATSVWHLFVLRLLNGMVAGFNPAATSLTSAGTPRERIGFAMGALQAAGVGGLIMGPLLGSMLAEAFDSFRPVFLITSGLMTLSAILMLLLIREKFDRKKAASLERNGLLADLRSLLNQRGMGSLFLITFILQFALFSSLPLLALFVQEITNNSERVVFYAGLIGAVTGVANLVASPILGWLGDRVGHKYILIGSLVGAVITLIPQAFMHKLPAEWVAPFWVFLGLRFLFGIFMGGMIPSINALLRIITPSGKESRVFGFNSSFLSLGNFIGPLVGGLFAAVLDISSVFLLSAALMLVNLVWLAIIVRRGLFAVRVADGKSN